jgi:hypothetical protein
MSERKIYRVIVSLEVEAEDEGDAAQEIMAIVFDDSMTIESISMIETKKSEP